jgi:hypothetical protein
MIHNKQSYIKSIALERTCCGSILKRIHKKLGDYLLKTYAPKKKKAEEEKLWIKSFNVQLFGFHLPKSHKHMKTN